MTDDTWPKIRAVDPLMTMTNRIGRNGTVINITSTVGSRDLSDHSPCTYS